MQLCSHAMFGICTKQLATQEFHTNHVAATCPPSPSASLQWSSGAYPQSHHQNHRMNLLCIVIRCCRCVWCVNDMPVVVAAGVVVTGQSNVVVSSIQSMLVVSVVAGVEPMFVVDVMNLVVVMVHVVFSLLFVAFHLCVVAPLQVLHSVRVSVGVVGPRVLR